MTLGSVAKGGDPLAERRAELAAGADTLKSITEEYLARETKRLRSIAQRRSVLERHVFPKLGARPIADIKRSEIVRLLDHVEDTAGPVASISCSPTSGGCSTGTPAGPMIFARLSSKAWAATRRTTASAS